LAYYRKLGFEGDTFAVLAALTSGYTVELPEELRGSFSASGVSHVLAVSGLHAGLIYMLLLGLLTVVPLWMRGRKAAQCLLVIGLLWAFAFFTGLSPSVVRAAIMFSLLAVSSISGWRTNALNSLAAAAMGMLVYNPCLLYEVSFQLSFVSVSAILIIQPWLQAKWTVNNPVMRKIWSLTTVSLAAQIGVLPLILFYFGSFPVYFLPANLLIVPLVTLIMYVAVAMLAVSFLPFAPELPAYLLKFLIGLLNGMTRRIGELPFATIDNIEVSATGVLLYYVILLCIVGYVLKSSQKKVTYHLLRR
jgi:competence protein ComEC